MKDILNKVFDKKIVKPIFVGFGTFAILTFIVFPGLTVANTVFNIISAIVGLFTLVFVFYYLKGDELYGSTTIEPGETELDYISPEELEPKKKRTPKKKEVKSEFPLPPHRPKTVKKVEPKKPTTKTVTTKAKKK